MIIHLTKTFQMLIARKSYNQKDFACDRNGLWPIFCCLCHSDVNSHFKSFNTSKTSLTFGEPHKLKHTLSTLSSKHDSTCHRKTCIGQKIITENPELTWQGIPNFWNEMNASMKHPDIWNFYSSLTMNNRKLIQYFRIHLYAIVSDMTHFLIPVGMREKDGLF